MIQVIGLNIKFDSVGSPLTSGTISLSKSAKRVPLNPVGYKWWVATFGGSNF